MSAEVFVSVGFAALFLLTPVALILWARSATMFSGKTIPRYDGPPPVEVEPTAEEEPSGEVLSSEEEAAWEELTQVSWNMPHQRD